MSLWKFDPVVADQQKQPSLGKFSHDIIYSDDIIFPPTGANGTIIALNATDGKLIWQTASIGNPVQGYRLSPFQLFGKIILLRVRL